MHPVQQFKLSARYRFKVCKPVFSVNSYLLICFTIDVSRNLEGFTPHSFDHCNAVETVNEMCVASIVIMALAILWHRLYVHHRLAIVNVLSTKNLSLAALVLRDGTAIRQ